MPVAGTADAVTTDPGVGRDYGPGQVREGSIEYCRAIWIRQGSEGILDVARQGALSGQLLRDLAAGEEATSLVSSLGEGVPPIISHRKTSLKA